MFSSNGSSQFNLFSKLFLFGAINICLTHLSMGSILKDDDERATLCVAHRGFSAKYLENSPAAFQAALSIGAKAIEFDVHHTFDGVGVIHHDKTPRRTMMSKDSRLCQLDKPFNQQTFDEIIENCQLKNDEPILSLKEALSIYKNQPVKLFVEIKDAPSESTAQLLVSHTNDLVVMSFDEEYLDFIRDFQSLDQTHIEYLFLQEIAHDWPETYDGLGVSQITEQQIKSLQDDHKKVGIWTVNKVSDMLAYFKSKVDYIISDHIDTCLNLSKKGLPLPL